VVEPGLTLGPVSDTSERKFAALRRLGELGREVERRRGPDPYPRPTGAAPDMEELRARRVDIEAPPRGVASGLSVSSGRFHVATPGPVAISMSSSTWAMGGPCSIRLLCRGTWRTWPDARCMSPLPVD
jgi:hypothetical protein